MMMLVLLSAGALAGPSVTSETVLQMRHDFFGEALVPAWETLQLDAEAGEHDIHGYIGVEWPNGLPAETDMIIVVDLLATL